MPSIGYSAAKRASPRTLSGPSRRATCAPMRPCLSRPTGSGSPLGGPPSGAVGTAGRDPGLLICSTPLGQLLQNGGQRAAGQIDLERVAGERARVGELCLGRFEEGGLRRRAAP